MPTELTHVPGRTWARRATDLAGAAGLLSLLVSAWWGAVVVALFALVLLGLTVQRVAQLPGELQSVTGAVLLLGAWAATLHWYAAVGWLDLVAHALGNGLLATVAACLLARLGVLRPPWDAAARAGVAVITVGVGVTLGVLWELGEWAGHTFLDDTIGVGYDDTVGDLAAGALGSLVAALVLARRPALLLERGRG